MNVFSLGPLSNNKTSEFKFPSLKTFTPATEFQSYLLILTRLTKEPNRVCEKGCTKGKSLLMNFTIILLRNDSNYLMKETESCISEVKQGVIYTVIHKYITLYVIRISRTYITNSYVQDYYRMAFYGVDIFILAMHLLRQ